MSELSTGRVALEEVARYRTAKRLLVRDAKVSVFLGVFALAIGIGGVKVNILNLLLVAIGLFVVVSGSVTWAAPGVGSLTLCAAGLLVLGMWNVFVFVFNILYTRGEVHPQSIIFGAFQFYWGIKMLSPKSRHAAIGLTPPPAEAVKSLDTIVAGIRKSRETSDTDCVEMECSSFLRPLFLRGKLAPGVAFFSDPAGIVTYVARPEDVRLTLKGKSLRPKKNSAQLEIRSEKFPCSLSHVSFERLSAWIGQDRPPAPPPPA